MEGKKTSSNDGYQCTQNLHSVSTRQQIVARIMELTRHIQMGLSENVGYIPNEIAI